jgi:hypothetical protein
MHIQQCNLEEVKKKTQKKKRTHATQGHGGKNKQIEGNTGNTW